MEQKPSSLKINAYWVGSLFALLIFFFLSWLIGLFVFVMGDFSHLWIGKVILLVFGCCGTVIGLNLLVKQSKVGGSLAKVIRIMLGVLLNFGIIWLAMQYQPPAFTGIIIEQHKSAFCLYVTDQDPGFVITQGEEVGVFIENWTPVYEQSGMWPWQKELAGIDALHTGQRVKVMFSGFAYMTDPISIDPTEIIVVRDEEPIPPNSGCRSSLLVP